MRYSSQLTYGMKALTESSAKSKSGRPVSTSGYYSLNKNGSDSSKNGKAKKKGAFTLKKGNTKRRNGGSVSPGIINKSMSEPKKKGAYTLKGK